MKNIKNRTIKERIDDKLKKYEDIIKIGTIYRAEEAMVFLLLEEAHFVSGN